MLTYRLVYGENAVFHSRADQVLAVMRDARSIKQEELYRLISQSPLSAEFQEIMSYLVDQGFVESKEWGYKITTKGNLFLGHGGYKGEARRKVFWAVAGIVTTIGAVFTIVAVIAK